MLLMAFTAPRKAHMRRRFLIPTSARHSPLTPGPGKLRERGARAILGRRLHLSIRGRVLANSQHPIVQSLCRAPYPGCKTCPTTPRSRDARLGTLISTDLHLSGLHWDTGVFVGCAPTLD